VIKNHVRYFKMPPPRDLLAVICSPETPLATAQARRVLPSKVPFNAAVFTASRLAFLLGAFLNREYEWLEFAMDDVLHQPPRARLIPGLLEAIQAAKQAGAYGCALSGAGSSVIALTKPGAVAPRVGAALQKVFARHGVASRWTSVALEPSGVRIRSKQKKS
jgi:homoserine kinase